MNGDDWPLPGKKKKPERPNTEGPPKWKLPLWHILLMLLLLWIWQDAITNYTVKSLSYSEFKEYLRHGEVAQIKISDQQITGQIELKAAATAPKNRAANEAPTASTNAAAHATNNAPRQAAPARKQAPEPSGLFGSSGNTNEFLFRTDRVEDPDLVKQLEAAGVDFSGSRPSFLSQFLVAWILPIGMMVAVWSFLSRRIGSGAQSLLSIGKNRARILVDRDTGVTFADVAGCDEAKFELQEVVDFLKNPDRYRALGARIPKGVLLVGPPGTGKTLLARAVAGEAGVKFFSISGSEFVEMFVGVGAARVRDLFQQAKGSAPCIVFIDELDAIGRQRGVHVGAVNDEREQTLNQLLVEMDGFEANKGVILLAATNRPEVLDRALLRPGRFDRQIIVDAPDVDGREAILRVHAKGKPISPKADLRRLAQATPGFSGADLANTINEAALLAARRRAKEIEQGDLEEAVEKVVAGPERKSRRLTEEEKRRVAYHEVGHAIVAAESEHADPVHKISIVPRGRAALGYTMQLPLDQQFLATRAELEAKIRGLLGGRAAEDLTFGEVSTGAENDLERATGIARQMVCVFGMSDRIGLAHLAQRQNTFLAGPDGQMQRDSSEATAREIDEEVKKILDRTYKEAKALLTDHRSELDRISGELLKRETISGDEFYEMLGKPRPQARAGQDIGPVAAPGGPLIDRNGA